MTAPEIGVVIATRDREMRLAFALEALARQTIGPERFEVVVVRAAPIDGPLAKAPDGLRIRFCVQPHPGGAAAQRNLGWHSTQAPLVAFTDDDCRPAPDWLERLLEVPRSDDVIVQGRTEPDPDERHLLFGLARSIEISGPSDLYETCNIAYPRVMLEQLDGFDERFPGAWGEDVDLGLRATARGAKRVYLDGAVVRHAVLARSLRDALHEAARYESIAPVIARNPHGRGHAISAPFVKRSHATLLIALVAGALAVRRRPALAAAAGAPYLLPHLRRHLATNPASLRSLARLAFHLPAPILIELCEIGFTLRGAIRHRVAVL